MPVRRSCRKYANGVACAIHFLETPVFTQEITKSLTDDEYRRLQIALALRPEQGPLIKGSGGLRKVRWPTPGRGKRGGLRIVYMWRPAVQTFVMLYVYSKRTQGDLTPAQLKRLRTIVKEELS